MSQQFQDSQYASRCSEKTLQSNDEGFFLNFADKLAEHAGKNWIEKSFGKLKSDKERLEILYKHEPVKETLIEVLSNVQHIYRRKSSEIASAKLKEAEKLLKKSNFSSKSLTLYSQAVLRSQKTGENKTIDGGNTLSLAFFGRSKALMEMNRFDYAAADIQTALKENLPDHLKGDAYFKLAVCYGALGEDQKAIVALRLAGKLCNESVEIISKRYHNEMSGTEKFRKEVKSRKSHVPIVTGPPSKSFPNAAETLELKDSPTMGKHVVCKGKIETGDTLVVEKPYAACLVPNAFGTCCQHCFKRLTAPVGCQECSNVAYCSSLCRDEAVASYHKYECKIIELLIGSGVSVLCHLALRMITQRTLEESMELYENKDKERVFSLCTNKDKRSPTDFFRRTVMAAFLLRCLQKVGYFGNDSFVVPNETELAVGEMLLFNLQILQFNAHEIYEKIHPTTHRFQGARLNYIGVGLYPTVALFNHQCYPSVTRYFVGKDIVVNAIRPLKDGELVAENYGPVYTKKPLAFRKKFLSSRYWFDCQCPPCLQDWPLFDLKKEDTTLGIRCPRTNCNNILSYSGETNKKCSSCNEVVDLEKIKETLKNCTSEYSRALEEMDNLKPGESIKILIRALNAFHKIAVPPHKETHLAEETLRACYADFGNTFEISDK